MAPAEPPTPATPAPELPAGRDGGSPPPPPWRTTIRAHWEVAAAALILLAVLAVIDVAAIGEPQLVLSFGPFALLLVAALRRLTPALLGAWVAAFVAIAFVVDDARYAGLAYPAAPLALLLYLQRRPASTEGAAVSPGARP